MEKVKKFYDMQKKYLFTVMCLFFLVTLNISSVSAADKATTKIKHKPIKHFVVEKRIHVQADVKDKKGIELVRCYFKSKESADFVFVPMTHKDSNTFEGILPAPAKATQSIDYLFLSVNKANVIVKTQIFTATRDESSKFAGVDAYKGDINVFSEIEMASAPQGFMDSIVMDVIESSARFGIVAGGIYAQTAGASSAAGVSGAAGASSAAGVSGAAASATSVGVVTAGAGLSTTAIVAGGVALAGGVGAAAAGGGGGGDSENPIVIEDPIISGNWAGIGDWSNGGTWQMEITDDNTFTGTGFGDNSSEDVYGTWDVNGNSLKATFYYQEDGSIMGEGSAVINGDNISGQITENGSVVLWSGTRQSTNGTIEVDW